MAAAVRASSICVSSVEVTVARSVLVASSIPAWRRAWTSYRQILAISLRGHGGNARDPRKSPASHQVFIPAMCVAAQVNAFVTRNIEMVTDSRKCEQCGVVFTPRREHARFCSACCRVAWNRLNASDPPAEGGTLGWTITAMRETIDRDRKSTRLNSSHVD